MEKSLEPEEVLRVAHAHLVNKMPQQAIAQLMNINSGRIAECCMALDYARTHVKELYEVATGKRMIVKNPNGGETTKEE